MAQAKISTTPFTCPSCVKKIERNVGKLDGVNEVQVMFNSNKVKVDFDESRVGVAEIAGRIEKLGYPVESSTVTR